MDHQFRILTVCTGNICRSPAAELLLRRGLGPGVLVESAGTHALVDSPIDPLMASTLGLAGAGPDSFRARALVPEMIERADLVLAMSREHRSEVVTLVPTAVRRTFTLTEFAAVLAGWEEDGQSRPFYTVRPGERLEEFMAVAARRRSSGRPAEYDIPDPFRMAPEVYRDAADRISLAVDTIVGCLDETPDEPFVLPVPEPVEEARPGTSERGLRRLFGRRHT
ncbi:protein-tyrosine phosphatase [Raineyella antarctica]|uniref:Protein-tyrosine phosphatase n=1 Tax=Raineyella antarctica TaxID=1577474 RepID=A0A1G6GG32_9ACTN|nr:hypothetical protein [Raineyella antarctica]SDB80136.1 protein-tyrosine phosphatase [Raineyella antarctica]